MNQEHATDHDDTDLDSAREDVARAEERLSSSWRAAKVAGEASVGRAMSVARPLLIGAAVVGGIALLVSSLTRRGQRSARHLTIPSEPSLLAEMTRAAGLALASAAARRLADRFLSTRTLPGANSSDGGLSAKEAR
jgi:hypothetical protein